VTATLPGCTGRATGGWRVPCAMTVLLLASCGGGDDAPIATSGVSAVPTVDPSGSAAQPGTTDASTPNPTASPSSTDGVAASAAGRRLTAADDGGTFTLAVDQTAELAVAVDAATPTVEGEAVIVIRTTDFAGDGRPLYEIRAVSPGRSTLVGDGFRIVLIVP
jgi:hypothetical protein